MKDINAFELNFSKKKKKISENFIQIISYLNISTLWTHKNARNVNSGL